MYAESITFSGSGGKYAAKMQDENCPTQDVCQAERGRSAKLGGWNIGNQKFRAKPMPFCPAVRLRVIGAAAEDAH